MTLDEWMERLRLMSKSAVVELTPRECGELADALKPMTTMEPEWIVNSLGELGVKVGARCFFLYKAGNIEYGSSTHEADEDGWKEGDPMMYRPVFKREFGECAHPINYDNPSRIGSVHRDDSDEWRPLPPKPEERAAKARSESLDATRQPMRP